ncbi:B-cell receptor-associated protein 31 [Liparis tanakae]|uniref:B-cell receptor-associated protein 31 n=1 Tax=Liparis tanakae TaxID=230148 RepID=A0A4Z2EX47_9TELE|nr:B-cell receptor-associated protein 31 [Liparis tanakae]
MDGKGEKAAAEGMTLLRREVEKLSEELRSSGEALTKSRSDADVMKKQMDGLTREYDRLLREHQELQVTRGPERSTTIHDYLTSPSPWFRRRGSPLSR